jgi:hypothetical protein
MKTTPMLVQIFRTKAMLICFTAMLALPFTVSAQQQEDDQQETYEVPEMEAPEQSNTGNGLANEETQGSGGALGIQEVDGTGGRGGSTAGGTGTLGNPTPDNRDPGGNPDVPFDPVMNILFLAGGLVFAYVMYRKQRLKAITVKS